MPGLRAVVFDLFGTLTVDQLPHERDRLQEPAAAALGVPLDGFLWQLRGSFAERATGTWGSAAQSLREVARRLGRDPSEDAVRAAVAIRESAERQLARPRAGVIPLLADLRSAGIPVGVLSDCTMELVAIWQELPYADLVNATVFSVTMGVRKPHGRMYSEIARRLSVAHEEILYVGAANFPAQQRALAHVRSLAEETRSTPHCG